MFEIDDLVQPRAEQIARRLVLFGRTVPSDVTTESRFARKGNPKTNLQGSGTSSPKTLQSQIRQRTEN